MKYLYDECVAICIIYWASIQIDSFIPVDSAEMFESWPQSRTRMNQTEFEYDDTMMTKEYVAWIKNLH